MNLQDTPVYLGRQPILDHQQQLVAYELLFRNSPRNLAEVTDGTLATATVVANAFGELGIGNALGCLQAYINVDAALLVDDALELLPPAQVVLEVLEEVPASASVMARLEELRRAGFQLALDDFSGAADPRLPMLPLADIVKIDLPLVGEAALPSLVASLRQRGRPTLLLLAEKIDSREQLLHCQALGFDLYQGYHFAKPAIITGRRLDNSKVVLLKLMAQILEDADTAVLEAGFKQAPGLSINLLRLVNSVASGLRVRISSLRHAITVLGRRQLQRWLQLLLYTDPSGQATLDNPLLQLAATRGRLMELLAAHVARHDERLAEHAFMVGVMSLTPALFGMPLGQVLAQVSLAAPICEALVNYKGRLGQLLAVVEAMEQEDPRALRAPLHELPMVHPEHLSAALASAMAWSAAIGREQSAG
jgi:c-di-GMP-related signal transduction protein